MAQRKRINFYFENRLGGKSEPMRRTLSSNSRLRRMDLRQGTKFGGGFIFIKCTKHCMLLILQGPKRCDLKSKEDAASYSFIYKDVVSGLI